MEILHENAVQVYTVRLGQRKAEAYFELVINASYRLVVNSLINWAAIIGAQKLPSYRLKQELLLFLPIKYWQLITCGEECRTRSFESIQTIRSFKTVIHLNRILIF